MANMLSINTLKKEDILGEMFVSISENNIIDISKQGIAIGALVREAEPFKRWLAKVGYERVQEIKDPELAHSVDINLAISPTVSVVSFRQYPGSVIKQLADKFQLGINNNQIETSGFQVRPHE